MKELEARLVERGWSECPHECRRKHSNAGLKVQYYPAEFVPIVYEPSYLIGLSACGLPDRFSANKTRYVQSCFSKLSAMLDGLEERRGLCDGDLRNHRKSPVRDPRDVLGEK